MDWDVEWDSGAGKIIGGIMDDGQMAMVSAASSGWYSTRVRKQLALKQLERRVRWFAFDGR